MRSNYVKLSLLPLLMIVLTGCNSIGQKAASLSIIYGSAAVLSFLLLTGYCAATKKKDPWYLLLFASVVIVNIGYFALGISRNLEEALLANRLAYLGSVFLPLSMCMIILNTTNISYKKWLPGVLLGIGAIVFLIAASPGYLDIYYKEVSLGYIDGVAVLNKVYGPFHVIYLIYLLGYFSAMVTVIVHAALKDKIDSLAYAVLLAITVFVNIGVWLLEQLVHIDFEFLSISYIISECFLLGLHLLMAEAEKQRDRLVAEALAEREKDTIPPVAELPTEEQSQQNTIEQLQLEQFAAGLAELTPKEQAIYQCYVDGMRTAEIMEQMNIKENTLKFHNKNLYGKLGVSSRKQLLAVHKQYSATKQ